MPAETQQEMFARLSAEKLRDQRQAFVDGSDLAERLGRLLNSAVRRNNEFGHQPFIDPRQAAMARTHFEQGFNAMFIGLGCTFKAPGEE